MTYEEETALLAQFTNEADGGHITDVSAIKAAYDEKIGHETRHPDDYIVLVCDGAAWHKSGALKSFSNTEIIFIPPYAPEMNPIEQIWKELRARGFHNEVFQTLEKDVDRLCDTICTLSPIPFAELRAQLDCWMF